MCFLPAAVGVGHGRVGLLLWPGADVDLPWPPPGAVGAGEELSPVVADGVGPVAGGGVVVALPGGFEAAPDEAGARRVGVPA
jgi:hypothetical protein